MATGTCMARIVVALGMLCMPAPALALDSHRPLSQALLRIWQSQQGLPRGVIFAIRQTSDGYLWLGTQAGLYRFDGVRFVPWVNESLLLPPTSKLWIEDLCEDSAGHLWAATNGAGVVRIRGESASHFREADGLPSDQIRCLLADRHGVVWIGTQRGLVRMRDGQILPDEMGLGTQSIHAISESPEGSVWIAIDGPKLIRRDGKTSETIGLSLPPRATIQTLCFTDNGTLWVGTSEGLLRKNGDTERLFTIADGLPGTLVHSLAPTGTNDLWVGTKEGLCRIQGERIERFQAREGLSQSTVHALCEDHEGNLWVGTKNGLNQFIDRRTLFPFTTAEGLPGNDTGPLLQDSQGTIWVGTLSGGLARFDGRHFHTVATKTIGDTKASGPTETSGLPSDRILSLMEGSEHQLWIGTDAGLSRWNGTSIDGVWTTQDGLPSPVVTCAAQDSDGRLWIGTTGGLVEFQEGKFISPEGAGAGKAVRALVAGVDGSLIASIEGTLHRLNNRDLSPLPPALQFSTPVDAFHLDEDQRLWLALPGRGLGLIEEDHRHEFGLRDGLFDDDIFGITSDDKGQLWMGCSRGMFAVNKAELLKFSRDEIDHVTSTPFSPTDALRTIESQSGVQPSIWKMNDGHVWLSTVRGIIVVAPEPLRSPLPPPKVLVDEVRVDGQAISRGQLLHIGPGRNNVHIHYTALSFAWPTRLSFRYKLEGFDQEWVEAGSRREAFYTNLPPGRYRFLVDVTTVDGSTAMATNPLEFRLEPHFYQSRWFLPTIGFVLAAMIWLAYRLRIRQVKTRWQTILSERSRIARELHDTLIQGFSGVTMQLQAVAARLRHSSESETLSEIIRDAGYCLSEARRSVAGLRNPRQGESSLATAIAETARQLTDAGDVRLQLSLAPHLNPLPPDVEYHLVRITQEAVANVVKHAGAGLVEVTLQAAGKQLRIAIQDDGSGFDATAHLEHPRPGHYGMIGMRERATQIGATIVWRSEPHRGTTVVLTISPTQLVSAKERLDQAFSTHG